MKTSIANQFRKPSGFWGRIIGFLMKKTNKPSYEAIINKLKITDNDSVLEIGYGHGEALKIIGERNKSCKISGIDFSELMFNQALKNNAQLEREGRLDLKSGDFLKYDFNDIRYTKIFCANVIYFWDDLLAGFLKVNEILESGGIYGIYMATPEDLMKIKFARTDIFNKYSVNTVQELLYKAGFQEVIPDYFDHGQATRGYLIIAKK
jgi:SAM-dependent methyltransferase